MYRIHVLRWLSEIVISRANDGESIISSKKFECALEGVEILYLWVRGQMSRPVLKTPSESIYFIFGTYSM